MANENEELAARPAGDGMPIGNQMTPGIQPNQVEITEDGEAEPAFDDDAAATIVWEDFRRAQAYVDQNQWLAEWQYIDYLYQSPNYDRGWRDQGNRTARISRFNVAKNTNTMTTQVRRGIFAEQNPFVLEPRGRLGGDPDVQIYMDAITELFSILSDRANFEYGMRLLIKSQGLQGTGMGMPGWEERTVIKKTRVRKQQPLQISRPVGPPQTINTWESDEFTVREDRVVESWPTFEYRRLGTTLYDPKWNTPNRPDLSAGYVINVNFVTMQDLQQMREMECYKDLPSDADLKKYFLGNPLGDAQPASNTANNMSTQSTVVLHAKGENTQTSTDPFTRPLMKIERWTMGRVTEILVYDGRKKTIRNEEHILAEHALGYTANWWDIDNCGYGMGIGRLNAGDQRMDQGVLNEVLKMIAFPMNSPILYNAGDGNAPTQNVVMGLGTFWGIQGLPPEADVNKAFGFMKPPQIPKEAWDIYRLGKEGGEDLVGANSTTMQGMAGGPGSTALKTATGVNRLGSKADENVSDPIAQLETVVKQWLKFLWIMICEQMPTREIRQILSDKFGEAIVAKINPETLLNAEFNIKILAGQKLAAKQSIAQLIPFLLQLLQQPQLLEYMHQKGWTINFLSIEKIFMRMSELQGAQDIIVKLTDEEKQNVQANNPGAMKVQIAELLEKLKGQNKINEIQEQGKQELNKTLVEKTMEHVDGSVPLNLAEARVTRNQDMNVLQGGAPSFFPQ
jgi:hypothetical protein